MENSPIRKQRAESIRLWANTAAMTVSALVPIVLAAMAGAGK